MEVKPGYKQTEVGVIPTDWEVRRLGDCANFRTGPFGTALHKSDYTQDGVPVINPMHLVDGQIEPTRTMTITEQAARNLSEFRLKPGEIVMGRRGDMGRCAVVQQHQSGWLCGTGSVVIRPQNADARFLQRVLSSPRAVADIQDASVGTTMVNLNHGTLNGLRLPFPLLPEQRAIADALSDVDGLLGALDRLIAKKRDLKQAAMQQLLTGQTRLPGFTGEWEERPVGSVCKLINGRGFKPHEWKSTGLPIIRIQNLNGSEDFNYFEGQYASKLEVEDGQLLFAWSGSRGTSFGPHIWRGSLGLLNYHTWKVVVDDRVISKDFFLHALKNLTKFIEDRAHGASALVHTQKWEMEGFTLPVPPTFEEQIAIAEVLSDLDAELAALEQRREKTRALKQGMMQELLTGRTRLV